MISLSVERGWVSATVAGRLLGVSRQRVHQLLKAGRITGAFLMDVGDGRELWCVPRDNIQAALTRPLKFNPRKIQ